MRAPRLLRPLRRAPKQVELPSGLASRVGVADTRRRRRCAPSGLIDLPLVSWEPGFPAPPRGGSIYDAMPGQMLKGSAGQTPRSREDVVVLDGPPDVSGSVLDRWITQCRITNAQHAELDRHSADVHVHAVEVRICCPVRQG